MSSTYRTVFRPEAQALGLDTTALVSRPDRRRLRVGGHRVIYTVDNGELVVWVVHVGHRSTVYGA